MYSAQSLEAWGWALYKCNLLLIRYNDNLYFKQQNGCLKMLVLYQSCGIQRHNTDEIMRSMLTCLSAMPFLVHETVILSLQKPSVLKSIVSR